MTITRDDASAAFFDGTARGVLLLRRCDDCGRRNAPRTLTCPACHSARLAWEPARGTGTLASWTVVHHRPAGGAPAPRTVAGLVQLDEGPWLHARIDGIDPSRLRAGLPLIVAFDRPADGEAIPVFQSAEPVRDPAASLAAREGQGLARRPDPAPQPPGPACRARSGPH